MRLLRNVYTAVHLIQIPRLTVADVFVQHHRLILGQNAHGINTGVDAVGERKVDETILTAIGDRWFCHFLCQGIQSAALSASQQHGDALFLDLHDIPPNINSKISFEWVT